jgi:hypothetical protein
MITLVKYSDKAIALFGSETKEIKEEIKAIGGRFNRWLKDPDDEEAKTAGWIISIKKYDEVLEMLDNTETNYEDRT